MTKERRSPKPEGVECAEAVMRDGCRWPLCDCGCGTPPAPIFGEERAHG